MANVNALIMYGDGLQAYFLDEKNPVHNRNNMLVQEILVAPSNEIKVKYNMTEEELPIVADDGNRAVWIEYPVAMVEWLNRSKAGAVLFIDCGFDGSRTRHMNRYKELLEWHGERDKIEANLRAQVSTLLRDQEDITSVYEERLRKMKSMADIVASRFEGEEEGGQ